VIVLGLDTCNSKGDVALLRDDVVLALADHKTEEDYSTWLLPAVDGVLKKAGISLSEVDVFGVAAGPGSFTALRVGLTTVKAWGEVYGKPIVPVSRLELIARQAWDGTNYVASWTDANRGQVFGAVYLRSGNRLERVGDEMVIEPGRFVETAAELARGQTIAWASSDVDRMFGTKEWKSREALGEGFELVSSFLAIGVARMAANQVASGRYTDALGLDANYVRRPDAEIFWKGRAGSGP
jgi:tRNA threonylcarbamoyladenosine biosynthesis protein TsaB